MNSLSQSDEPKQVLLLGMAFHDRNLSENPTRGQGFRDRIRCEALEQLNYIVRTLDDKHHPSISIDKKHCQTNFADARRMKSSMDAMWKEPNNKAYDHIILDYFFSPAGWARTRWTDKFYKESLPLLAADGYIKPQGCIWLPNLKCVIDALNEFDRDLNRYFIRSYVKSSDLSSHPLYLATENVEDELLKCPDKLNNRNQIEPILKNSEDVFVCLIYDPIESECKKRKVEKVIGIKRRRLHEKDFSNDTNDTSDVNGVNDFIQESNSYRASRHGVTIN